MSFDLESLMDDMLAGVGGDASDASDAEVFEEYDAEDAQDAVPASWGKQSKESAVEVIVVAPAKREVVSVVSVKDSIIGGRGSDSVGSGDVERAKVEKYLGWQVERTGLVLATGEPVKTHVAQVRSDSRTVLGVVTAGFQTIQNSELLALADAVRNDTELRFANAGIVDGGSRVFFQCRGESFDVGNGDGGDAVTPYMLFCNGHDGSLSCRMAPMTERMQCQNQLGNIVRKESGIVVIRHTGDMKSKIEQAKRLGRTYFATIKANREAMLALRDTAVKTADLQKFFHECYSKHFSNVQMDAKTEEQERAVQRMKEGFGDYVKRFEKEKSVAGTTAWNMANAYTWWLQHCKGVGKNPQKTAGKRMESSLFGVSASRSVEAFRVALGLAS